MKIDDTQADKNAIAMTTMQENQSDVILASDDPVASEISDNHSKKETIADNFKPQSIDEFKQSYNNRNLIYGTDHWNGL